VHEQRLDVAGAAGGELAEPGQCKAIRRPATQRPACQEAKRVIGDPPPSGVEARQPGASPHLVSWRRGRTRQQPSPYRVDRGFGDAA
jgi:hypothetical protein